MAPVDSLLPRPPSLGISSCAYFCTAPTGGASTGSEGPHAFTESQPGYVKLLKLVVFKILLNYKKILVHYRKTWKYTNK